MLFSAVPKLGCSKVVFVLKLILWLRGEYRIDMYIVFIDLVKANDIAQCNAILIALWKIDVLERDIE